MRERFRWLAACLGLGAMLPGCGDSRPAPPPAKASEVQAPAPAARLDWSGLVDIEGAPLADAGRSAAVLVFTRTDCPVSNRYAPTLRDLDERYRSRGVEVFLVYVDPRQSADDIRAHLREYDYPCRAVADREHRLAVETGATITPEAVVVDRQGALAYRGRIDDRFVELGKERVHPTSNDLADAIDAVLAGRAPGVSRTKAVGCYIGDLR